MYRVHHSINLKASNNAGGYYCIHTSGMCVVRTYAEGEYQSTIEGEIAPRRPTRGLVCGCICLLRTRDSGSWSTSGIEANGLPLVSDAPGLLYQIPGNDVDHDWG